MSAEVMMPAAVPAEAVTSTMTVAAAMSMAAAVPSSVPSSMAAALGDHLARQRQDEGKNRNCQRAPEHGTLPAVTPPTTRRK